MELPTPVRVLVVDDSAVVRKVLGDVLNSNSGTTLAGTASSGEAALSKIDDLKPDVVTLDIEMPGMNGLEALAEIRKRHPRLPVIMFSTLTESGGTATLEALALGANDYATKPTSSHNLASAKDHIERDLIGKIVSLRGINVARPKTHPTIALPVTKKIQRRIDVVAIGTSTGGPNALAVLVSQLPAELPVPIVLMQHMPKLFTRLLAERLTAHSKVLVREGESGLPLQPGKVWIAPGDFHMTVARRDGKIVIELNQDAAEHSCRPAVDVLFRSVARTFGPHALAVVLTGMGSDGALGAKAIRDAGGEVLVQDEASSVVWGMPGAVVAAGQADDICALSRVGSEIVRRVTSRRWMTRAASPSTKS